MTDTWSNFSISGSLASAESEPAPALQVETSKLPERVDLRKFCPPVENQLNTQSCVANAVVAALELQQIKAGMAHTDLSRLFVYYNARKLFDMQTKDGGTFVKLAMAAMLAYGCCEERLWPFDTTRINTQPPIQCYQSAQTFQAFQFARTPNGEAALSVLAQDFPVVFTMTAPLAYYQAAAKTGIMPRPDEIRTPPQPAGHSMLLVGYDLADRTYLVRNSWGPQFADNGYFRIPFETLDVWSLPNDYWTIGEIEKVSLFNLTGPTPNELVHKLGGTPADATDDAAPGGLNKMRSDIRARLSSDLETSKRDFRNRLRGK